MSWISGRSTGLAALLALLALGGLLSLLVLPAGAELSEPVSLDIDRGTSSYAIAEELESKGVISSKWAFLLVRALRPRATLMAGEYRFPRTMSARDAFERLTRGGIIYHPVTIPEGWNRMDVAEAMAATGFVTREDFLKATGDVSTIHPWFPEAENLEGFLFPDTYYLDREATAESIVAMMTRRFLSVYQEATRGAAGKLKPYEIVTLASLIEKETANPSEHRLVSSVFHNRLKRRMRLQCDPTVVYGLLLENRYRGKLYESDLEEDHAYNTYTRGGLPPGPIANPGRATLKAATSPTRSDYLFFVAETRAGRKHVFSKSLTAHNRAVAAYRRSRPR